LTEETRDRLRHAINEKEERVNRAEEGEDVMLFVRLVKSEYGEGADLLRRENESVNLTINNRIDWEFWSTKKHNNNNNRERSRIDNGKSLRNAW